ncbi:MAG: hypothetical protein A4E66_02548 [Syntrophus sp. PtaB.Bin001]|nr:MAG: hypothetical protein A4E66_02548 [Syntrophus sp. PtaB.Bin001]
MGRRLFIDEQIELDLLDRVRNMCKGQKILPVSLKSGEEGQINPPKEQKSQQNAEQNMPETNLSYGEFQPGLAAEDSERIGDQEPRYNQCKDGNSHSPVINPNGHGPVFFFYDIFHGNLLVPSGNPEFMDFPCLWIDDVNCTGHAGVERVDGPDYFEGLIHFCKLCPD